MFDNNNWVTKFDNEGKPYKFNLDNNLVDLTNRFSFSPKLKDIKDYINNLVANGAKFATLNPDWYIDTKVNSKAKGHIIYSNEWDKMSNAEKDRHNKYVLELKELLNNSEYIGEKTNLKKDIKPKIEKYHYFKTNVKIDNNFYEIIFDTEQYIGETEQKPQTVHLYNVHEINKTSVRSESKNSINTIGSSKNIINDVKEKCNPIRVKKEEEREMALLEELKKLVASVENAKEVEDDDCNKVENEHVDKRELIDEVGGILKDKVDDEIIRTIIGKMEKLAYDKSEAKDDKADNEKDEEKAKEEKKAEDDEKVEELEKDVKKDVENKCKNSVENSVDDNKVENAREDYFTKLYKAYNASMEAPKQEHITQTDRLEAGKKF